MEKPNFELVKKPPEPETKEELKAHFHLRLHIIRHGKKDGGNDVTPEVDMAMKLKPEGRMQAHEKGVAFETSGGIASGSTRARARETAMHMANANNPEVSGEETYDELVEKLGGEFMAGPYTNTGLDMPFSKDHEFFSVINEKANEGKLLTWYGEVDDENVKNGADRSTSVYGIQAREVASIVARFARIAMKMVDQAVYAKEKGKEIETEREQVMGTHGGVNESFLAEVIRRTLPNGEEERWKFLNTIPNGVSETQGSDIDILAVEGIAEPSILVKFTVGSPENQYHFEHTVPLSLVDDIVRDFSPKEVEETA